MTEDSRYIRCNIKPDKSVHTAKPYIIRMEITDTSNRNRASLAAAMPQFGKLPVEYSYFYVNISAFNDVPLIEDPPKEEERPLFGKVQLIVICISISIVLMIIVILLLYTPMKRNIGKAKVSGESYKFYIKSPSRRKPNPKDIEGGAINTSKRKDSLKDVCSSLRKYFLVLIQIFFGTFAPHFLCTKILYISQFMLYLFARVICSHFLSVIGTPCIKY